MAFQHRQVSQIGVRQHCGSRAKKRQVFGRQTAASSRPSKAARRSRLPTPGVLWTAATEGSDLLQCLPEEEVLRLERSGNPVRVVGRLENIASEVGAVVNQEIIRYPSNMLSRIDADQPCREVMWPAKLSTDAYTPHHCTLSSVFLNFVSNDFQRHHSRPMTLYDAYGNEQKVLEADSFLTEAVSNVCERVHILNDKLHVSVGKVIISGNDNSAIAALIDGSKESRPRPWSSMHTGERRHFFKPSWQRLS